MTQIFKCLNVLAIFGVWYNEELASELWENVMKRVWIATFGVDTKKNKN